LDFGLRENLRADEKLTAFLELESAIRASYHMYRHRRNEIREKRLGPLILPMLDSEGMERTHL
jgi:hypothetical protein